MSTRSTRRSGGVKPEDESETQAQASNSSLRTRRGKEEPVPPIHEDVRKAAKPLGTPKVTPRKAAGASNVNTDKEPESSSPTRSSARRAAVQHTQIQEAPIREREETLVGSPARSKRMRHLEEEDDYEETEPQPILQTKVSPMKTTDSQPPYKKSRSSVGVRRPVIGYDDAPPVLTRITHEQPDQTYPTTQNKLTPQSPTDNQGAMSPELGGSARSPPAEKPVAPAIKRYSPKPAMAEISSPNVPPTPIHAAIRPHRLSNYRAQPSGGTPSSGVRGGIRAHTVTFGNRDKATAVKARTAQQMTTRTVVPIVKQPTPAILGGKTIPKGYVPLEQHIDVDAHNEGDDMVTMEKRQLGPVTVTKYSDSGHVTVEAPAPTPYKSDFKETPLPGSADEVESYPCKFCTDRVFLTSFGLERHTKMGHADKLDEVLADIERIQEEWKKREEEREKQRERIALAKIRQEALAAAVVRDNVHNDGQQGIVRPRQGSNVSGGQATYDSCGICGLLINSDHASAMQNHLRAHEKNDQLREQLMSSLGPEFVARVTCHECQLVFTDERKLIAHSDAMHVRRRKYVCKWCGHVCPTMSDLNQHKTDAHNMNVNKSKDKHSKNIGKHTGLMHGIRGPNGNLITSVEDLPCKTTCDSCGLVMVKPSLLIRHMMRVHNKTNFTSTIHTKGMPPFKICVDRGSLSWWCCNEKYTDRDTFVSHRRSCHKPRVQSGASTVLEPTNVLNNNADDYVVLVMGDDGQQHEVKASDLQLGELENNGEETIVLTEDQLKQLGIGEMGEENMMVLIDDGSGNYTYPDGTPVDMNDLEQHEIQPKAEVDHEQQIEIEGENEPEVIHGERIETTELEEHLTMDDEQQLTDELLHEQVQHHEQLEEHVEQHDAQGESQFVVVQDENGEETTIEVPPGMQLVISEEGDIQIVPEGSIDAAQVQYLNHDESMEQHYQ